MVKSSVRATACRRGGACHPPRSSSTGKSRHRRHRRQPQISRHANPREPPSMTSITREKQPHMRRHSDRGRRIVGTRPAAPWWGAAGATLHRQPSVVARLGFGPAYLSGGGVVKASMVRRGVVRGLVGCGSFARGRPGLLRSAALDCGGPATRCLMGVIPLGEALRPLDLSRPFTRVACRQQGCGSWPRRIGVSEGLTRAKGRKVVVGRSGPAGTGCQIAQPKPGSSGQSIRVRSSCWGAGLARRTAA